LLLYINFFFPFNKPRVDDKPVEANGSLPPTPRTANVGLQEVASTSVTTGTNSRKIKRNITASILFYFSFLIFKIEFYFSGGVSKDRKTLN